MTLLARTMLRRFGSHCYQHEVGLLEDIEWLALRSAVRDIRALPGVTRYWAQLKPHMSERLRRIVEDE